MNLRFLTTPFALSDAYKLSHWRQYPKGTTAIYSNFTPRKSRRPGIDKFVFFGLQHFLTDLTEIFNEKFFNIDEDTAVNNFDAFIKKFFGASNTDSNDRVRALHQLGYLPIRIQALPEGSAVDHNIPPMTITSTHDDFFWFSQWLETWMSAEIWKPCTSATTAFYYRQIFNKYNRLTSDNAWLVDFQGHDFSFRGMSGCFDACASGAGHLLSFKGTDTCAAVDWIESYYPVNTEMIGTSVPATEHSVATAFLDEFTNDTEQSDYDYIDNILNLYPTGIVSVVCDTYDFWGLVTKILPKFKDRIMAREGKLVIRPDSSPKTPVEIIVGDKTAPLGTPENKGLVRCLYEIFGGTENSKGYIDLDPHIGAIYGDSITLEYCEEILSGLMANGFSSDNIVLGIGSFTYNYVTRDTHGIAIKCTAVRTGDHWRATFKDPKTDNSGKKSAKGFLQIVWEDNRYVLKQNVSQEDAWDNSELKLVYLDGKFVSDLQTFDSVRENLKRFL